MVGQCKCVRTGMRVQWHTIVGIVLLNIGVTVAGEARQPLVGRGLIVIFLKLTWSRQYGR